VLASANVRGRPWSSSHAKGSSCKEGVSVTDSTGEKGKEGKFLRAATKIGALDVQGGEGNFRKVCRGGKCSRNRKEEIEHDPHEKIKSPQVKERKRVPSKGGRVRKRGTKKRTARGLTT